MVEIPYDVQKVHKARGRVPVKVTFDGHPYRGSIFPMGGRHILGVTKEVRSAIGKDIGDRVTVALERDRDERVIETPPELDKALRGHRKERATWNKLSYTHRREFAQWITEAKKPETRARRAAKAVQMLTRGETR